MDLITGTVSGIAGTSGFAMAGKVKIAVIRQVANGFLVCLRNVTDGERGILQRVSHLNGQLARVTLLHELRSQIHRAQHDADHQRDGQNNSFLRVTAGDIAVEQIQIAFRISGDGQTIQNDLGKAPPQEHAGQSDNEGRDADVGDPVCLPWPESDETARFHNIRRSVHTRLWEVISGHQDHWYRWQSHVRKNRHRGNARFRFANPRTLYLQLWLSVCIALRYAVLFQDQSIFHARSARQGPSPSGCLLHP